MTNVDVNKPFTWKKYHGGMCDNCIATCCTMPVEVSREDLLTMGLITDFELEEPGKNLEKSLKKQGWIRHYRHKTDLFMLKQKKNGDCILLDSELRKCTVHDRMPKACREFTKVSSRPGFCPYIKKMIWMTTL